MTEVGHMKSPINAYGRLVYLSDKPSLPLSEAIYVQWRWSKGKETSICRLTQGHWKYKHNNINSPKFVVNFTAYQLGPRIRTLLITVEVSSFA